jgi:methylthioribulose-1-phosphate dehydratase
MNLAPGPDLDTLPPREALAAVARDFHARGWMWGTAGNLSVRDAADPAQCWISASGRSKGHMQARDFLCVDISDGVLIEHGTPGDRASAEAAIHRAIYTLFPVAGACLHGHSVAATRVALLLPADAATLDLPPIEMLKGIGIREEDPQVQLPLFVNHADVARIAADIRARFSAAPPPVPALLIRGHGITVWGASLSEAYNRFESLEFILSVMNHPSC